MISPLWAGAGIIHLVSCLVCILCVVLNYALCLDGTSCHRKRIQYGARSEWAEFLRQLFLPLTSPPLISFIRQFSLILDMRKPRTFLYCGKFQARTEVERVVQWTFQMPVLPEDEDFKNSIVTSRTGAAISTFLSWPVCSLSLIVSVQKWVHLQTWDDCLCRGLPARVASPWLVSGSCISGGLLSPELIRAADSARALQTMWCLLNACFPAGSQRAPPPSAPCVHPARWVSNELPC